jgi:hypothetical protein
MMSQGRTAGAGPALPELDHHAGRFGQGQGVLQGEVLVKLFADTSEYATAMKAAKKATDELELS